MKFKTQESKNNPFLEDIIDLIVVNQQFGYAIRSYKPKADCECADYFGRLNSDREYLIRLAISLNSEHVEPTFTVEYGPAKLPDLIKLEEKYYNMLKEVCKNALEANDPEVVSYLTKIICKFKHYFCTLNEDDDKGEASS